MRFASANLELAGSWVLADGAQFTGSPSALSLKKAIEIVRKDLLDVPGAPAVPAKVDGVSPLSRELEFLKQQGRVRPEFGPQNLANAFAYPGLKQVQADPKKFRLFTYDYAR